jgi:hypothetical protein
MVNSSRTAPRTGHVSPGEGDAQAPLSTVQKRVDVTAFFPGQTGEGFDPEIIRQKINSEEYIYGAIQRIAQVLSNELLKVSRGRVYERQRKRRK